MIVACVSGHGFGHAMRTAVVLRRVRELQPQAPITLPNYSDFRNGSSAPK